MRVISGTARGMKINTLDNNTVRPTTYKVKEAVFSMIRFELEGREFLDLFAGSGQMSIEALSGGAKWATAIDSNREAIRITKENLHKCRFDNKATVIFTSAKLFLEKCNSKYDIAYLDPPYLSDDMDEILTKVPHVIKNTGLIICETQTDKSMPNIIEDFIIDRQRRYGKILITIYRHKDVIK